jgi:hypothetical protein
VSPEIDTEDQVQRDAVESALSYSVSQAVIDNSGTGEDPADLAAWISLLGPIIVGPISSYLRFTLLAMAPETPRGEIDRIVSETSPQSVLRVAAWASDTLASDQLPVSHPTLISDRLPQTPVEVSQRISVGSSQVVRSTVTEARESARLGLAKSLGAVSKVWRTRKDVRVRVTHGHLEGIVVPIGGVFLTLSGSELRYPGDPDAPLSETAGCRCRLGYRIRVNG